MGIGAAVTKSGLLARVALWIMRVCPPTFNGQVLALLGSGVIIGPFIPSTIAKVSIVGAMATDIGEKLGFEDRSKRNGRHVVRHATQAIHCSARPF